MITIAQRKRLRKAHKESLIVDKENTRIINLLADENYSKHLLLGILATTGTLPDFSESKVCKCCGQSQRVFHSEGHKVCTDCLGQSIDGTLVPEWSNSPIRFTLSFPDGSTKEYQSVSSAAKELGLNQSGLQKLVVGALHTYKGLTAEVIPTIRTFDELEALRASKRLR